MTKREKEPMSFEHLHRRAVAAALRRGGSHHRLSNGAAIVEVGRSDEPALFILSGLHGDERSGPLAVVRLLEDTAIPLPGGFGRVVCCAVINDEGWGGETREWCGLDLNRVMSTRIEHPHFVEELMQMIAHVRPVAYVDLHEDSDTDYAYVFVNRDDPHDFSERLAEHLQASTEQWSNDDPWEGSSEVWARSLGATHCTTVEVPPGWPLEERVLWHTRALTWCLTRLPQYLSAQRG